MEEQNTKRIKFYHKTNLSQEDKLNEIYIKLSELNTKIISLDNKINQIGNISIGIAKNFEIIKTEINKIIKINEDNKIVLLTEIGEIQNIIIQKLLINKPKPLSNNMLSAYS